ncbi:MAG: hypothetical protein Q9162_002709 [Coniocarpon cinnabarinum]
MASILSLPPELKIEVFSNLEDFDDVANLASTCWSFQAVLTHEQTQRSILKRIVSNSPVFAHDAKLARIQDQTSILHKHYASNPRLYEEERLDGSVLSQCLDATSSSITDADVVAVHRRWRTSHRLQSLYVDPHISALYSADKEFNEETYAPVNQSGLFEARERVHSCVNQPEALVPKSIDVEHRHRFYRALTAIHLTLSAHWLLSRTHTDTWQELQTLFDSVWSLWDWRAKQAPAPSVITPLSETPPTDPRSPLFQAPLRSPITPPPQQIPHEDTRNVIEMLELYNFVYTFLLRVVFPDTDATRPWLPRATDNLFTETGGAFRPYHWSFFVRSCDRILSPSDVLDLAVAASNQSSSHDSPALPDDKVAYLTERGAIDLDHGTSSTRHPDGVYLDWCISERELAECVWRRVSGGEVPMNAQLPMGRRLWLAFRAVWAGARGKALQWEERDYWTFVRDLEDAMMNGPPGARGSTTD